MWKLTIALFIAAFSAASAQQNVTLPCEFLINLWGEYCYICNNINHTDPSANVILGGTHIGNRTNLDVEVVEIEFSNTPFMIQEIFSAFPNFNELVYYNSNLQSINIPFMSQLRWVIVQWNNISVLQSGSFASNQTFFSLNLDRNNIQSIEEDAFAGLGSTITVSLRFNNISTITQRHLTPLTNVSVIDFEGNSLTRIDETMFANNQRLQTVYFEYNNITAVHPHFARNIPTIGYINLLGNECVSEYFSFNTDYQTQLFNNMMQRCFRNFNGTVGDSNTITMQFTGPIVVSDPFGNVIFRHGTTSP